MKIMELIDKATAMAEIDRLLHENIDHSDGDPFYGGATVAYTKVLTLLDTLEVKDPYEQRVQYDSIKAGIQAHAETYSFNIESELFNQLTIEQQKLWRKEIEQACISGGNAGVELAKDIRYKENVKVKDVDLENYISNKLRELGADLINHKPYSFNRGLNVGKTSAYHDILDRINARKEN